MQITMLKNVKRYQVFKLFSDSDAVYEKCYYDRKKGKYCCQSADSSLIYFLRGTFMVYVQD